MKRTLIFLATAWLSAAVVAQDYQISFTAEGEDVENIDSIVVRNLNQELAVTLQWNDVLHLVGSATGIDRLNPAGEELEIYPNPFSESTTIIFNNKEEGMVVLTLYDMAGKILFQQRAIQPAGRSRAEVSGLAAGSHLIRIETEYSAYTGVLLSTDRSRKQAKAEFRGTVQHPSAQLPEKKSSGYNPAMVDMPYQEGDTLLITAYLGDRESKQEIVPDTSFTVSFDFRPEPELKEVSAGITIEGGSLELTDENGNRVILVIPPGAVLDSTVVTLAIPAGDTDLPIERRSLRTFEIGPADMVLFRPAEISIEYPDVIANIETTAIFSLHSGDLLIPLGDHAYPDGNRSITARTWVPGAFAEGEMNLEQINTQFDLVVADLGIAWGGSAKSAGPYSRPSVDGSLHRTIWSEYKGKAEGMLKYMELRELAGYYDELPPGEPTLPEEFALLCTEVISKGVQEVLDMAVPDDPCDHRYTLTLIRMMEDMNLYGCTDNPEFTRLDARYQQMLLDCKSFLTIDSELNIEAGGLLIITSGAVPLAVKAIEDGKASVAGIGSLDVSGGGDAGGVCTSVASGATLAEVLGSRNAAYTFVLTIVTTQDAVLTTTCPGYQNETPLTGTGERIVTLSKKNGFTAIIEERADGTVYTAYITLNNPYTALPAE